PQRPNHSQPDCNEEEGHPQSSPQQGLNVDVRETPRLWDEIDFDLARPFARRPVLARFGAGKPPFVPSSSGHRVAHESSTLKPEQLAGPRQGCLRVPIAFFTGASLAPRLPEYLPLVIY